MKYIYNGRSFGKNILFHNWFIDLIPTLKKGWIMGIPTKDGVAIFKFKGISSENIADKLNEIIDVVNELKEKR